MMNSPRVVELAEYQPCPLDKSLLSESLGTELWEKYGRYPKRIEVQFPSPQTENKWQLISQGWVGHIPLSDSIGLSLAPKTPIHNLFGMLDYAHDLDSFKILKGQFEAETLDEFFQVLAKHLAKQVVRRTRMGLYKEYVPMQEKLAYVRGRLDVRQIAQAPWEVRPSCRFEEHLADIDENRIIAWTLHYILRTAICKDEAVRAIVRKAYRGLASKVGLRPPHPSEVTNRLYNRLNYDYEPMHLLCAFFLEHRGPQHRVGEQTMLPFLVNMNVLFEKFVGKWLEKHLPQRYRIETGHQVKIDVHGEVEYTIDMVLWDRQVDAPKCVIDTKYKLPDGTPSTPDIHQIHSYAATKGCQKAFLVYPKPVHWHGSPGGTDIRTVTFALDGNIEEAGQAFLQELDLVAPEVSDTSTIYSPAAGQQASRALKERPAPI
jgi:5-methylcytosine-specific restriction enzyme subunit McrC